MREVVGVAGFEGQRRPCATDELGQPAQLVWTPAESDRRVGSARLANDYGFFETTFSSLPTIQPRVTAP